MLLSAACGEWDDKGVDAYELAAQMLTQARVDGQCARTVVSDADADALQHALRKLSRTDQVGIRTARIDNAVVVVRVDAQLWSQDAATMRRKLTPPA